MLYLHYKTFTNRNQNMKGDNMISYEKLSNEKIIKIDCLAKDIKIDDLCNSLNMSRQLMWHHVKRKNTLVLTKIENYLKLSKGTLTNNL